MERLLWNPTVRDGMEYSTGRLRRQRVDIDGRGAHLADEGIHASARAKAEELRSRVVTGALDVYLCSPLRNEMEVRRVSVVGGAHDSVKAAGIPA